MRIEDVRAVLRPRSGWQAVDLGCLLWRRSLRAILLAWFPPALLLAVLSLAVAGGPNAWSAVLFWWTFPVASRGVLFVVSRALFGDEPRGWRALGAVTGFGGRGLASLLLGGRLSPQRTNTTPVSLLEGLKGSARRRRVGVLARVSGLGSGAGLMSLLFVVVQAASLLGLLELFHDNPVASDGEFEAVRHPWILWGVGFLSVSVFEPLNTAIGFSIYLDGRSHVEGWDVELALRTLAGRLAARPSVAAARRVVHCFGGGVVALLLVLAPLQENVAVGDDPATDPASVAIEKVLEHPDFGGTRTSWFPEPRWEETEPDADLSGLVAVVARLLLLAFYVALACGGGVLVYGVAKALRRRGPAPTELEEAPASIVEQALAGGEEALPEDLANEVRALLRGGDGVRAAGLLYRAALVTLVDRHRVPIEPSDTEAACVRRARRRLAEEPAGAFREVTHLWQRAAYARLELEERELEAGLAAYGRLRAATPAGEVRA